MKKYHIIPAAGACGGSRSGSGSGLARPQSSPGRTAWPCRSLPGIDGLKLLPVLPAGLELDRYKFNSLI